MNHPGFVQEEEDGFVLRETFDVVPFASTARRVSKPKAEAASTDSLPTFTFVVVWLLSLALHGLCATYLLAMALLYYFMENPLMAYYTNLLALPKHRYFRLFGFLVGILGLKRKRKAAQPVTSRLRRSLSSFSSISSFTAAGLQEVLSVEGNHFALIFTARKAVEDTDTMKPATPAHIVGLTFMRRVLTPLGFLAAGAVVLGLHLHAAHLASTADAAIMKMCLQTLRPWFAENVSCSVLEFNCYRHGVLSPASDALDHLQNDAVTAIVFEHCPEFEMPSSIRRFRNLLGVELWNVSIVKWDVDSALSANLHPSMIYLVMVYTNMTEMPQGLLTRPLPPLLGDIEISITNLTRIPDELAEAWENVRLVYLEHAPLKEFPTALFQIPSLSVSLIDDGLESVPEDLFTTVSLLDEYLEIAFSYNPIKSLPKSIRDGLLINYLSIDHTELTDLPAWVDGVDHLEI
uniref:Uncharacterized protein n=1 Tax=Phytophthora ramorum TaxID=164328 RepID=H3HB86_PHYRM